MVVAHDSTPPLTQHYNKILQTATWLDNGQNKCVYEEFQELPVIDLAALTSTDEGERTKCMSQIVRASSEWGFFQIVNHGISPELLSKMRREQIELFNASFSRKSKFGLLNNSYCWGTPTATSPNHFSWSEAFHIPLTNISDQACYGEFSSLREVLVEYAAAMQKVAKLIAGVLIMNLGEKMEGFEEIIRCDESTCFLRLNRYLPCSLGAEMYGLVPHTDSDFITVLHQDQVGGLHIIKDSKWVAVKPNKHALIVNIGDLFQAWSNDLYKSVEHKVMANPKMERLSVAYFLCPSEDSLIKTSKKPSHYRNFTYGEYRRKIQEDTKLFGRKFGLSRFQK